MTTITADLDSKQYGKLLAKTVPRVIKTEEENDRMLGIVESLLSKGEDRLTPEEEALLELLTELIHDLRFNVQCVNLNIVHIDIKITDVLDNVDNITHQKKHL